MQKKRFNKGNIGFDGGRDQNSEISPISGSGFHGSNLENIPNFTSNFGATAPRHATRNLDQVDLLTFIINYIVLAIKLLYCVENFHKFCLVLLYAMCRV